jgi:hypothetical protein
MELGPKSGARAAPPFAGARAPSPEVHCVAATAARPRARPQYFSRKRHSRFHKNAANPALTVRYLLSTLAQRLACPEQSEERSHV